MRCFVVQMHDIVNIILLILLIVIALFLVWQHNKMNDDSDLSLKDIVKPMSSINITRKIESKLKNKTIHELRRRLVAINGTIEEHKGINLITVFITALFTMINSIFFSKGQNNIEPLYILVIAFVIMGLAIIAMYTLIGMRYNCIKKGVIELLIEEKLEQKKILFGESE